MDKVCDNCACYEACIYANPNRTKDCALWQPKMEWIPVSERLPEEEELVLIICKNGARFVGYYKRFHYNNEISWGIKTALNSTRWLNKGRVTHWMPLPNPPKEE